MGEYMYEKLSSVYQELVGTIQGSQYFYQLAKKYLNGKLLDCACGTGELVSLFYENKYEIYGFDLSAEMLSKCCYPHLVKQANMIDFHYDTKFDGVMCFCDSINYLLSIEDITKFFTNVYQHLNNNGIFIFDMHRYETLLQFTDEYYQSGIINDISYEWQIEVQNDLLLHTFVIDNVAEQHVQRIYSLSVIIKLLQNIGFTVETLNEEILGDYALEKEVLIAYKKEN